MSESMAQTLPAAPDQATSDARPTATFLRLLPEQLRGNRQTLWELSEPLDDRLGGTTTHVIISSANFGGDPAKPETLIFASTPGGFIEHLTELEGSYRGGLLHGYALQKAGYRAVWP